MVFKITEKLEFSAGSTEYKFNVLSEYDGIELFLTNYKHSIEGMKPKRWSNIGDDGSFVHRDSIEIPVEVIESVKAKIMGSISDEVR
ncbi:MAG: hypothetical protein RPS47_11700 [Colwellia sp.]|jgi:hypothetical protein